MNKTFSSCPGCEPRIFFHLLPLTLLLSHSGSHNTKQTNYKCPLIEQNLELRSNFRCDQLLSHDINFSQTLFLLKSNLDDQQSGLRCNFIEEKNELDGSSKCDKSHDIPCYESGHTLFCYSCPI